MKHCLKPVLTVIVFSVLCSCIKTDDYQPLFACDVGEYAVTGVLQLLEKDYQEGPERIMEDMVLSGVVVSDDAAGNHFGELYMQDNSGGETAGILIKLDLPDLHLRYPKGSRIWINMKDLYIDKRYGALEVGGITHFFGQPSVGRLPAAAIDKHLVLSCDPVIDLAPEKVEITRLSDTYLNTWIQIEKAELAPEDLCRSFAVEKEQTRLKLLDCHGAVLPLESSGYAEFFNAVPPTGSFSVNGILKRDSRGYFLKINQESDIQLAGKRCDNFAYACSPPAVNTSLAEIRSLYQGTPLSLNGMVFKATVTATDHFGNFPDRVYMQEENSGIRLNLERGGTGSKEFKTGETMVVSGDDLWLYEEHQELQIGYRDASDSAYEMLPEARHYRNFYTSDKTDSVTVKQLEIDQISEEHAGTLAMLKNVHFETFQTVLFEQQSTLMLADCKGDLMPVIIENGFSGSNEPVPDLHGNVLGIVVRSEEGIGLRVRNTGDFSGLTNKTCDIFERAGSISGEQLDELVGADRITENIVIEGVVTSDYVSGHFPQEMMMMQVGTKPVLVHFNEAHSIAQDSEIKLALLNVRIDETGGLIHLYEIPIDRISAGSGFVDFQPRSLTLEDSLGSLQEGELITITGVAAVDILLPVSSNSVEDCYNSLALFVPEQANFADQSFPEGSGNVSGIYMNDLLHLRNMNDLNFADPPVDCSMVRTSSSVLISEIADPANTISGSNGRFLELYNASEKGVRLDRWELRRYTNANSSYTSSSVIRLSGYIQPKETVVIAANAVEFEMIYGFSPDIEGDAGGPADSNGDDSIELIDGNGNRVDIFGQPGTDGTGTLWDFQDGRARRKAGILQSSNIFNLSEWEVVGATQDSLLTAPVGYDPGEH
ncbi:DUF5689 domain-containing protein [Robertkochia aurantiaca]|uniref:DUF5689 domain-containing protein n=1 Tax=Robertkochia aurantiaca TaxID=2873700 RepID=UPI001CCE4542|nr:DUF5689 domain-containing protein [Robertkochia sp. 3YJGBD-33]